MNNNNDTELNGLAWGEYNDDDDDQEETTNDTNDGGSHNNNNSNHYETTTIETTTTTTTTATATTQAQAQNKKYLGGFTTSICALFQNNTTNTQRSQSRHNTDCCIFACCGTLTSDRSQYLLTRTHPTSWWKRFFFILVIPLLILYTCEAIIAYSSSSSSSSRKRKNDVTLLEYSDLFILLYFIMLFVWAQRKRIEFRQLIVGRLYEVECEERGEEVTLEAIELRKKRSRYHSIRAHKVCGCYPLVNGVDDCIDNDYLVDDDDDDNHGEEYTQDVCGCIWKCLSKLCCGCIFKCWIQCFGICALGQEEREVERIVTRLMGREALWIDYVTFQPYSEYFPKLQSLRTSNNTNLWTHYQSLSKLSFQLLKSLGLAICILFTYALIDDDDDFTIYTMLVLIATFCQAFLILYFVHWKNKKFDLSLDAVVKYFACGFLLTTAMAVVFEMLFTIAASILLELVVFPFLPYFVPEYILYMNDVVILDYLMLTYPAVFIAFYFVEAFLSAAFVEEVVKYFGYWMVIHPDLMEAEDIASLLSSFSRRSSTTRAASSPSTDASTATQTNQEEKEVETGDDDHHDGDIQLETQGVESLPQHQPQLQSLRSLNSVGNGITVAMVAVALGFACCENLVYIFVYTPPNLELQLTTLFSRSIFPVHPLCAAIQSIGVCRRDLEKEKHIQLGRIILPSVILHGTFDFSLMVMTFLNMYNILSNGGDPAAEMDLEEEFSMDLFLEIMPSLLVALGVVIVGWIYFVVGSRLQKARLDALDIEEGAALISDASIV